MTTGLRLRNSAPAQLYVQALSSAYANNAPIFDPSVWRNRDPEVEDKMLLDADIRHAVEYRQKLVAGRQWNVMPRDEGSERADLACAIGTALLRGIKGFTAARHNLARACLSGQRYAAIHGEPRRMTIGDGRPRTWWVPARLEDIDKRRFRKHSQTAADGTVSAVWQRWSVARREWQTLTRGDNLLTIQHTYIDTEDHLGYGSGLLDALGWWWYAKSHVWDETLKAVERFAQGVVVGKVDALRDGETGLANAGIAEEWLATLAEMRSRGIIVCDSADNIEVISGSAEGFGLLSETRAELRTAIFTLVLGANLSTSANEGGSYALAEVQENSTESIVQFDREALEETLSDDLIGACWRMNWPNIVELGLAEEQPRFNIAQEKRHDPVQRATVAQTLNAMGVDIAADDLYEQTGFRKPQEGEEVISGSTPQQQTFGFGAPSLP